jgi:RimJ/RimL family protein N-acetyltransferase
MVPRLPAIPDRLVGDGFALRTFESGDGLALWQAVEETRAELQRWQGLGDKDATPELAERRVAGYRAAFEARTRLQYAIVGSDGRLLGGCALEHPEWDGRPAFQLGYWIRKSAGGQGVATRAARLVTRFAFEALQARRVAIWTESANARSAAVARRLGFALEGRLRNERRNPLGLYQDTLVFARTDAEGL